MARAIGFRPAQEGGSRLPPLLLDHPPGSGVCLPAGPLPRRWVSHNTSQGAVPIGDHARRSLCDGDLRGRFGDVWHAAFGLEARRAAPTARMCGAVVRLEALALPVPSTRTRPQTRAEDRICHMATVDHQPPPRVSLAGVAPIGWVPLPKS